MAELVGVFAVSHTPVMTNAPLSAPDHLRDAAFEQFRRVGHSIAALDPDAIVLISNDHLHNFFLDNFPAFCIGVGDRYPSPIEEWLAVDPRTVPGHPALGAHILSEVISAGFDPAFSMELTLDHGMVTPLELAGIAGRYPVVPISVNAVQPPLPTMARSIDFGRAIGSAITGFLGPSRVVVLATGGLSHDVGTPRMGELNADFDREFLRLLEAGDADPLARFAQDSVHTAGNGAEEVRNWLIAHGIAGCDAFTRWFYEPVAEWYTGIALGQWRTAGA